MTSRETLLQMARRHVSRGEDIVLQQRWLVANLRQKGLPTAQAATLLAEFEQALESYRADLRRIEHEMRLGRRNADGSLIARHFDGARGFP